MTGNASKSASIKVSYPKSHFVSLIGEAATGTLIPYMGYLEKFDQPLSVTLLYTPHVANLYPVLANTISKLSPNVPINGLAMATSQEEAQNGAKPVEEIFRDLEDNLGPLAVNMMGGMKKSSLAGMFALKKTDHVFLQLSEEKFAVSRQVDNTIHTESLQVQKQLTPKQYLELQQLSYHIEPNPPWDLLHLCRSSHIPVPADALFNVVINKRRIDCLWTHLNVLCFLIIHNSQPYDGPKALSDARRIELLADTKNWTNGLFNRRFYVFENLDYNVERYNLEASGRILAYKVDWRGDRLTESAQETLREIFWPPKPNQRPPLLHKPDWQLKAVPTLITSLSRLSEATILAINSHQKPQVVLLYTPEDEWVNHMAKVYQQKAAELGLKSVYVLATDFSAANVHAHLPPELAKHAEVNVTPGTKPQGTALGLWAKNHGAPAWLLDRNVIRRLGDKPEERPVVGTSLQASLDFLLEAPVTDYGWNRGAKDWNDPFFEAMLSFMAEILNSGQKNKFYKEDLITNGYSLCLKPKTSTWRFSWPGGRFMDLKDGHWYEKLTAKAIYAINILGGTVFEVSSGVAVSAPGRSRFLTERDVLAASSDGRLFMVSCKTSVKQQNRNLEVYLSEVKAMAKTLSRFTVPLLCTMSPEDPIAFDEVYRIGWTTLVQPKVLKDTFNKASKAIHG
ncbi:MAG: hypothetical protein LBE31_02210 [Deltaproteobacteria bacterium]|jgi:hypothetical protein|nr:hypothetical protein [Deltaproteobacteria bacterium]